MVQKLPGGASSTLGVKVTPSNFSEKTRIGGASPFGKPLTDQFVYVYYFRSESSRDQFWPEPDTRSKQADQAMDRLKPLLFEQLELGTHVDDYGVWIIQ